MPLLRTALVALAGLVAAMDAVHAQEWPAAKPVKIVVPFAPGGSSDQLARLLAPDLSATFGQQFYIENRAGSSGAIGAAQVAKSPPDGYTLVNAGSGPHLTGPAINPNIGYDPLNDFTHIAMLAADSYVLVANTALGAKSIDDLVKIGRGRILTSASPGAGSLGHLILERFKRSAKLNIQHVPSPNSGMQDLIGNHINLTLTTLLTAGLQIRGGLLVPLAVTSMARHPAYPDIPTFAEQGFPDVRGDTWFWLAGPGGMPPFVVRQLNQEVRRIVKTPKMQEQFNKLSLMTRDLDSAGVTKFVADEYAMWAPLAKEIGLRVQ
ncbi:MAG: tripartite tricarboxylate transporter substrate binding protein [Xanthobacteraceae bacterium]|nr:tripartite tricarboxylate transporter substrate binding protein [Xanthobacteraceae bacterium]